jgi:hypothetical protein
MKNSNIQKLNILSSGGTVVLRFVLLELRVECPLCKLKVGTVKIK